MYINIQTEKAYLISRQYHPGINKSQRSKHFIFIIVTNEVSTSLLVRSHTMDQSLGIAIDNIKETVIYFSKGTGNSNLFQ